MSWISVLLTLFFGFFSGFTVYHIAMCRYNLKRRCWMNVPRMYANPLTRGLYFIVALTLFIAATYFAKTWWLCSLVVVWNLIAWQNGNWQEYNAELQSMAKHLIEKEDLSMEEALKKAKEIIDITNQYSI